MRSVLDAECPDLVVFTGDVIAGSGSPDPAAAMRGAVAPAASRGLPWCMVFGNHDDEGALSRAELLAVAQDLPGCIAESGPASLTGVGNYRLAVSGRGGEVGAHLYFLDSGGYAPPEVGGMGGSRATRSIGMRGWRGRRPLRRRETRRRRSPSSTSPCRNMTRSGAPSPVGASSMRRYPPRA